MGLLKVIYRDEHFIAINKPDALIVHRTRISSDHVFALQLLRDQIGQFVYPVHRLDRPTSGVLIFALSSEDAAVLAPLFNERKINKTYLAIVRGITLEKEIVDYALHDEDGDTMREAISVYQRVATVQLDDYINDRTRAHYSLVAVRPKTGRTHQIRRHFRHLRHPIVGDTTHGDSTHNRFFRSKYQLHRLLLHAYTLSFIHPFTQKELTLTARFPDEFLDLFDAFGWSNIKQTVDHLGSFEIDA